MRGRAESRREEITVDKPLLTVDRQMGLVIVCPEGKVRSERRGTGWTG